LIVLGMAQMNLTIPNRLNKAKWLAEAFRFKCDCSNCQIQFVQIESCLKRKNQPTMVDNLEALALEQRFSTMDETLVGQVSRDATHTAHSLDATRRNLT